MPNILVTAIGSFSGDIVIKNLKKEGHYVIGCDIYPREWIIDARNVDLFYQAPYVVEVEKYLQFINHICITNDIDFVIPLTDPEVELLSKYKQRIESNGAILCTSDYETISLCRDKYKLPIFLAEHGIDNLINTYLLDEVDIKTIKYPIYAKPRSGRSSQGCMMINDEIDLKYLMKKKKNEEYIVQPYINGKIITVDVVRDQSTGLVTSIPRRELLRNKSGAGLTVEIFNSDYLNNVCKKVSSILNIYGTINIEFIEYNNRYYLLEINPRFSGGVEFSYIAGYNLIIQHLNCFRNIPIETLCNIHKMIISKKYEEYITWEDKNDK